MAAQQIEIDEELIQYSLISCPWCELPPDLEMEIMERLPLECCCQLRSVCKGWNDLLSSTRFNHIMGSESASSSRQPRLLLCTPKMEMACLLYSFFTNSWRTISLSFLLQYHYKDVCAQLNYRGSASGLLLLDLPPFSCWGNMAPLPRLCVCNPLSKSVFSLPQIPSVVRVMATGIAPGEKLGSYVVFVIGMNSTASNSVVAYDSLSKSWRTAGTLPNNLVINNDNVIFSKGFFYCLTSGLNGDDRHVVAYNIKEGNATIIAMPATDKNDHYWPRLLSCRGGCGLLRSGLFSRPNAPGAHRMPSRDPAAVSTSRPLSHRSSELLHSGDGNLRQFPRSVRVPTPTKFWQNPLHESKVRIGWSLDVTSCINCMATKEWSELPRATNSAIRMNSPARRPLHLAHFFTLRPLPPCFCTQQHLLNSQQHLLNSLLLRDEGCTRSCSCTQQLFNSSFKKTRWCRHGHSVFKCPVTPTRDKETLNMF